MGTLTRRGFLKGAGSAAPGLSLASLAIACRENQATMPADAPSFPAGATQAAFEPYGDWRDLHRQKLPTHKEPPKAGGDYPLRLTGGHTRWSIHSIWRDEKLMLQLQRGEPVAYMRVEDAAPRRIKDNDRIRMYNDVGACELLAKISPSMQPRQIIVYQAWEGFQFKDWRGNQEVVPSAWKSLHIAKYSQLHTSFLYGGPHHNPRGTTVDVARVA
jgi:nitrate reductase alpha subunit